MQRGRDGVERSRYFRGVLRFFLVAFIVASTIVEVMVRGTSPSDIAGVVTFGVILGIFFTAVGFTPYFGLRVTRGWSWNRLILVYLSMIGIAVATVALVR